MNTYHPIQPLALPAGADKRTVRRMVKEAYALRSPATLADASARIMAAVETLPEFSRAQTLLLYWAMPSEVDTRPFIRRWSGQKRILLPVMQGERLLLRPYTGEADLVCHPWGVWEPACGEAVGVREVDLAVVPGAAFDPAGGRLGYGKGFYDRLLDAPEASGCLKVGVCFDFQFFERVPRQSHDIAMDRVIAGSSRQAYLYNPEQKD